MQNISSMTLRNVQPRRIRLHEYHRMGELGIFARDERVELIDGVIVSKFPQNTPHATAVRLATWIFTDLFRETHIVSCQTPFDAGGDSEPEPDFALLTLNHFHESAKNHQQPDQADLILEIADSSLSYDRNEKASLYARAGIPEYWILDLQNRRLEIRQQSGPDANAPLGFGYRSLLVVPEDASAAPLCKPDHPIRVADLLPPI